MKYDLQKNNKILLLMVLLYLTACAPDRFTLDKISGQNRIEGFEIRSIHDAEVKFDNAFIMNENGAVSLRAVNATDGTWDFGMNYLYGQDLNIVFRDVPFEYKSPRALCLNLSGNHLKILETGKEIYSSQTKYDFSTTTRVKFENDGYNYTLIFDCDTIYKGKSKIPTTEYVIFESLNNTKVFFSGINFSNK
jgi:hypothetical protein